MARRKKRPVYSTMFRAIPHQRENGSWRIQIQVTEGGKKVMKSFSDDTPIGAVKKAEDYLTAKKQSEENLTVGECVDRYIEAKTNVLSPTTIEGYHRIRRNYLKSIADIPVKEIDSQKMQIAVNLDSSHLSPKTVKGAYMLFSSAIKAFRPDVNFSVTLPAMKKKIKSFPKISDIIQAIQGTEIMLPGLLAMWLSLRMSEVRGIRYKDISADNILTIQSTVVTVSGEHIQRDSTKTYGSTRQLRLPPYILSLIQQKKEADHASPDDCIITLTGSAIYKRLERLLKRKGLQHISFHDLRHINASVMVSLGVPDKYAMERGGWSSPYILQQVYQHTFSEHRKEIDTQIDDFFMQQIRDIDSTD